MTEKRIENLNIGDEEAITTPDRLKRKLPLSENSVHTVMTGQKTVKKILIKEDHRLFVVVGPCSIHDADAAREYGAKLKKLADEVQDTLFLIMRVYFEKPRTRVGWQGLLNDPYLDNSCKVEDGLYIARNLLRDIADMGLPVAGEALDIVTPQYIQDLFSWTAIGARTTESQTHRKMASGLSCAVGFKNATNGSVEVAVNAMVFASQANNFISVDPYGRIAVIRTTGNQYTHIVLRGGSDKPNYDEKSISDCENELTSAGLPLSIMVDCSHSNSEKNPDNQALVAEDITRQITNGNKSIVGLMIESNLKRGNQAIGDDPGKIKYGVSVTDPCIDWIETEKILRKMHVGLKDVLPGRIAPG